MASLQGCATWRCERVGGRIGMQGWMAAAVPTCTRRVVRACAGKEDSKPSDDSNNPARAARNKLETTIRRKQSQIEAQLKELGQEALEEKMQSSVQVPARPAYRLSTLIAESVPQGKTVLAFELARPTADTPMTSKELTNLARQYQSLGADALVVPTDSDDTPTGAVDLWTVCQAVRIPVLAKDWMIHPLQVVEVKQAGAAGVIGVINQVNGRGTAVMSSFAAAVGLDAPVEVVNSLEVEALARAGVVFYGINLSVGLSLPIPGFSSDIAHGILGKLPFGSISMVGVRTLEEARKARMSGADSLLIKRELIAQYMPKPSGSAASSSSSSSGSAAGASAAPNPFAMQGLRRLVEELQYLTSNDD